MSDEQVTPRNPQHFTPPVEYKTTVPCPVFANKDTTEPSVEWSKTSTVVASVCAEYTTVTQGVSAIAAAHGVSRGLDGLSMALDGTSQPIVFAIGTDNVRPDT